MFTKSKRVSVDDFDWDRSHIWVQKQKWLRGPAQERKKSPREVAIFCDNTKRVIHYSRAKLEAEYIFVHAQKAWKPRFNPLRAVVAAERCYVSFGMRGSELLEAGGLVLKDIAGRYSVVTPARYASDFMIVGGQGAPRPVTPFGY